jgi:hypothetical protein
VASSQIVCLSTAMANVVLLGSQLKLILRKFTMTLRFKDETASLSHTKPDFAQPKFCSE